MAALALESPSQPTSKMTTSQTLCTAQKILQLSYMELLYERAQPDPQLRRLLAHIDMWENANRMYRDEMKKRVFRLGEKRKKMAEDDAREHQHRQFRRSRTSLDKVQRARTLSEFQAMTRSEPENNSLRETTTAEAIDDSDERDDSGCSDQSGESQASEPGHEDHDDEIWNQSKHPISERVEILKKPFSVRDDENLAKDLSKCTIMEQKQDSDHQLWEEQPHVFSYNESEQAFYDIWL